MGDAMREYREAQQKRRATRLPKRQQEIEALAQQGYAVKKLTEYQYRINDMIDLYPIHRRWHNIKTGLRGTYHNVELFVKKFIV